MNIGIFDPDGKNNNPLNDMPYSDEYKNLSKMWSNLPGYEYGKKFLKMLKKNDIILIISATGSGKSVLIPKFCFHYMNYKGLTVMTLPKKQITKNGALFSAKTLDTQIGEYVGYQYRGEKKKSDKTSLLYCTDGTIISMFKEDPLILEIDILIIDEAHERATNIDLLLYLVKNAINLRKSQKLKELKLVIMSATIDESIFKKYFEKEFKYDFLEMAGKPNYPIDSIFLKESILNKQNEHLKKGVEIILDIVKKINENKNKNGDIIFFLPSISECKKIVNILNDKTNDCFCMALYSGFSKSLEIYLSNAEEYKKLNEKFKRRIFISTNVAESSLTLDNIVYVVDSGLEINILYDPIKDINVMKKELISQSNVKQRKGRTGRTMSGFCYHLYTEKELKETHTYPLPEIKTINLHNICLLFLKIQTDIKKKDATIKDVKEMFNNMIEPPEKEFIENGFKVCIENKLIENNVLTKLGNLVVDTKLDIYPALSLLYITNISFKLFDKVYLIICMISLAKGIDDFFYRDINIKEKNKIINQFKSDKYKSDHILMLELFKFALDNLDKGKFNNQFIKDVNQRYKQKRHDTYTLYKKYNIRLENVKKSSNEKENIINSFLYGFKNNTAINKNGKFLYNGVFCDLRDVQFDYKNEKKIMFSDNLLINNNLKLRMCSSYKKNKE